MCGLNRAEAQAILGKRGILVWGCLPASWGPLKSRPFVVNSFASGIRREGPAQKKLSIVGFFSAQRLI